MKSVMIVYCVLAAVVTLGLLSAVVVRWLWQGRRGRRDADLSRQYLRILVSDLMSDGRDVPLFPCLYCSGGRLVLAETLAHLVASTYGLDAEKLRRVVVETGLEEYLLRRARRTRGDRRAWFLALLSRLPVGEQTAQWAAAFSADRDRSVRFYALMVQLAYDSSFALERMAAYPVSFSSLELSEIVAMLRRGVLPVAYESLLGSPDRNLRSLGLCVVRQFGIEEAETLLLQLAEADESPELGREALYTLCALQRPLSHREVALRVAVMTSSERKALLRYMALEGYAGAALVGLFNREEGPYFEALLHSYKRTLVWA